MCIAMSALQKDSSHGIAMQNYNFFTSNSVNTTMFLSSLIITFPNLLVKALVQQKQQILQQQANNLIHPLSPIQQEMII